ncbi:MAG: hypothetical protein HYV07_02375 [Deltaproteobacteria bacterium]|nr:hypothetical protein [Deltaproteobacteria bacterium]
MDPAFTRTLPGECLSDLALDRIVAELDSPPPHLDGCPRCRAQLETFRRAREANPSLPKLDFDRPRPGHRAPRAPLYVAAALSAAAALTLFVVTPDETRRKGSEHDFGFFVRHADQVRRGQNGEIVHPGDQLRFVYSTREPIELAVVSIDPEKEMSVYHPAGSDTSTSALVGKDMLVPTATELDESIGRERLLGIFCRARFRPAEVAGRIIAGQLVEGCESVELRVEKRSLEPSP